MKNYLNYQIEDFVQDPYFRRWVLGKLPPEDRFWEIWQTTHPEREELIEKAKSMVIALQINPTNENSEEIKNAIETILANTVDKKPLPFYTRNKWAMAASVALLLGFAGYWYLSQKMVMPTATTETPAIEAIDQKEINIGKTAKTITLSDGSQVILEGNSSLQIGQDFGQNKREVYLSGEAFFQVTKNADKPFLVYSGKVVTKVLGTSFRIKAYEQDADVSVDVRTGKVTVFKQSDKTQTEPLRSEEIILTPNQQAVFVKKEDKFVKTLVEKPAVLNKENARNRFEFSETPIIEVLSTIEELYGVKIIYDTDRLKDCNLTGSLNDGSFYDKLTIVCETIQATYKVMDGQVVIDGRGCR
ncbi:FecR family protein [Emticicia sp. C21]|uniref:FecR family protein n=1 Tax=Emticicia sp. C21 TaxID=2302915 RepID=UPI000E347253|nr:FecR family protein [Emticicia sp. C21]RFS15088.1 FecR family protein [Emticicia sp. C21]